ncbi:MAG: glycosyltransferase [Acidobacteriota bacterium]
MTAEATLAVVIPTHNRRATLAWTLAGVRDELAALDGATPTEIVVVDDGSDDPTPIARPDLPSHVTLRWLRQPARGPAAARNRAIAAVTASWTWLLGDDTRPEPGCLAHLLAARDRARQTYDAQTGVQGHIDWDPNRPISEVMDFLAPAGPQFWFRGLRADAPVPPTAVLGSHLLVPTAWLRSVPYDEGFPAAALEDTAWAFDARRRGWSIVYAPDAICWHRHRYDALAPFLERQRRVGRAARHALRAGYARDLAWPLLARPMLLAPALAARHAVRRRRMPPEVRRRADRHRRWHRACFRAFLDGLLAPDAG